ncbi:sigma-70 family RNA polymerase sigma factor [Acetoanaerobium noterae]|uniref:RNA polymerase sigma factor n=1 Tax=Acetoanaerobium noterae TaxID=745369 RepID=UPI0028AA284D|nr:sigma-70 family RNA polymerase sigma factor [Acetoanaerobium noterae]
MVDLSEIYSQYFSDVYKYAYSLCKNKDIAEEITQDTFFKAMKNIDTFNGSCKLFVWLCQIAKNTYFTYLKKEKKFLGSEEMENIADDEKIEQSLLEKETAFELHRVLHRLEEPYKEVFSLRVFGELSFMQIAELFGKTESWARVTYYRSKNKIKELLI